MITFYRKTKGTYRSKPITAVVMDGVITRFEYEDKKGHWHFPLIEDGKNVDEHLFELGESEQLSLI